MNTRALHGMQHARGKGGERTAKRKEEDEGSDTSSVRQIHPSCRHLSPSSPTRMRLRASKSLKNNHLASCPAILEISRESA
jgi:hypothetical protein